MKVIVGQKNLRHALGLVERVVSRNVSLPMLSMVLLKTENGRLRIAATNLEIGVTSVIGAKIDEVGEIAVPGRILSDLVGALENENVTLTTKNNNLLIHTKTYKTNILGADAKEYPIIPKITTKPLCMLTAPLLRNTLLAMSDSVAMTETRPELSGVFVQFTERGIIFAATDSFRLTEKKLDVKNSQSQNIIVPRNTLAEMIRISSETEGDFTIKVGDNQISFSNEDVEVVSRLVDGHYPDYAKVVPEHFVSKALISREEFEKAIRLAGLFSSNIADIKLQCNNGTVNVSASNSDKGEMEASVEAILKNEPFELSLNYRYLLDGLKVIPGDKTVIEFTGKGGPLVLRPADDKKDTLYLIMPLRS